MMLICSAASRNWPRRYSKRMLKKPACIVLTLLKVFTYQKEYAPLSRSLPSHRTRFSNILGVPCLQ